MDLICPSCQKRLTIEDRFAGKVVKCPLCGGMLQAPVLLNMPVAAPPPAPPPASPGRLTGVRMPAAPATQPPAPAMPSPPPEKSTTPPAAPAPSSAAPTSPAAPVDVVEVVAEPPPAPSVSLGEYKKSVRWHLRPDVLEWIAPVCVAAIFLLSFFAWYVKEDYRLNLWELAFTSRGYAIYTFYTVVFVFLALPAVVINFCLEKRWIPMPDGLRPYWPWRALIVGGVLALPFVLFVGDYIAFQFLPFGTQASIAMKLAFRLHLLAVIACALQFWLEQRKANASPLPRFTFRW